MRYININGKISPASEASVAFDNGAFRYGYGLFETLLFENGSIQLKELHWERLFAGMKQLYFDIPKLMTPLYLEEEIIIIVKKNQLERLCRVRLQIYAGSGGLYDNSRPKPDFIIECFHLELATIQLNETGLVLGIAKHLKKSSDMLSNLKTCNSLIYAMAAQQAMANRWNDALILNTGQFIIESTIANIFWVKDQRVYTPPLSSGCVAGVMRNYVINNLKRLGIDIIDKYMSLNEVLTADELFLTNAVKRIKWVGTFENKFYINDFTKHINKIIF